jgi:hypothetical protein
MRRKTAISRLTCKKLTISRKLKPTFLTESRYDALGARQPSKLQNTGRLKKRKPLEIHQIVMNA